MNGYLTFKTSDTEDRLELDIVTTDTAPTLEEMQEVVGGYIETMFTISSPIRTGYEITGYVNEEGLIRYLPIIGAVEDEYGLRQFAGNLVVVGLDPETGDTVTLSEDEIEYLSEVWNPSECVLTL